MREYIKKHRILAHNTLKINKLPPPHLKYRGHTHTSLLTIFNKCKIRGLQIRYTFTGEEFMLLLCAALLLALDKPLVFMIILEIKLFVFQSYLTF